MITGDEPISGLENQIGLTIRQHFAAIAMQGVLANEALRIALLKDMSIDGTSHTDYIVRFSVEQADALVKELNKDRG